MKHIAQSYMAGANGAALTGIIREPARLLGNEFYSRITFPKINVLKVSHPQHPNRLTFFAEREEDSDDAAHILIRAGMALKQAGADFLVICTNTMHKVANL